MDKNKVRVNIAGVTYSLITDETAEYTAELAAEIDAKMKEMQGANPFMSTNQAAVLLAIDFADQAKKAELAADGYRAQIKDYLKDASDAQTERDFYKRELDRMRTEAKAKANQINLFAQDENDA